MSYVVKKPGSGLLKPAGSSFGGMSAPAVHKDLWLTFLGSWTDDLAKACRFNTEEVAWRTAAQTLESGLVVDEV